MPARFGILLILFCVSLASAQGLSGRWVMEMWRLDARGWDRISLRQEGEKLEGSTGSWKLSGIADSSGRVVLEGKDDRGKEVRFTGKYSGDPAEMAGTAVLNGEDLQWRATREPVPPASPRTIDFEPTVFHRRFSGSIAPAARIFPGDTVRTWTVDAGGVDAKGRKLSNGGNPQTGPFYIEGALPGDVIAVTLTRIRPNRDSAFSGSRVVPGALNPGYLLSLEKGGGQVEWVLDRERGIARVKEPSAALKDWTVSLAPMLGCIAVAPPRDTAYTTGNLGNFGGNLDYNQIREGVTVYLPVYQAGALLFVGDGHAAQGDGELTGDALETSMDLEFKVDLLKDAARGQGGPRVVSEEWLMASGIGGSLQDALQMATSELQKWLMKDYGFSAADAGTVLGAILRYDIAEVVDPQFHVVARVNRKALPVRASAATARQP